MQIIYDKDLGLPEIFKQNFYDIPEDYLYKNNLPKRNFILTKYHKEIMCITRACFYYAESYDILCKCYLDLKKVTSDAYAAYVRACAIYYSYHLSELFELTQDYNQIVADMIRSSEYNNKNIPSKKEVINAISVLLQANNSNITEKINEIKDEILEKENKINVFPKSVIYKDLSKLYDKLDKYETDYKYITELEKLNLLPLLRAYIANNN